MKRHKLDIYVDGSLAKDNTNGIGICVLFNEVVRFKLGKKLEKKVPHSEVVELFAVESVLSRLNGDGSAKKVSNSDITIHIDNSTVVNYFNKGTKFKNIPTVTKNSCDKSLNKLREETFNNVIEFKKIDRSQNISHDLAYDAAVNGKNISHGDMASIINDSMTIEKPLAESNNVDNIITLPKKSTILLEVAKTLIAEQEKITLLDSQISILLKDNEDLQSQLTKTKNTMGSELSMYKEKNEELLSKLEKANAQITSLLNDNSALQSKIESNNKLHTDAISKIKEELDMYKKKVFKFETQRKSRLMREKLSKTLSHLEIPASNISLDVDAEIACSVDSYDPVNINSKVTVTPTETKPMLSRLLKRISK